MPGKRVSSKAPEQPEQAEPVPEGPPAKRSRGKAAAKEAAVVKKEPGVCVGGLSGKDLSNKVYYKMKSAPAWIKAYYDNNIKYNKAATVSEKEEFLRNFLSTDGWKTAYFTRLQRDQWVDSDKKNSTWMSWRELAAKDSPAVLDLAIAKGKLLTRPHSLLDPDDPAAAKIDARDRLQYKWVVESEEKTFTSTTEAEKQLEEPEGADGDEEGVDETAKPTLIPETRQRMINVRAIWGRIEPDIDMRMHHLSTNEYVAKSHADCLKLLKSLKAAHAKMAKFIKESADWADDAADAPMQEWEAMATSCSQQLKDLKSRLQSMRQFTNKMTAGSSSCA